MAPPFQIDDHVETTSAIPGSDWQDPIPVGLRGTILSIQPAVWQDEFVVDIKHDPPINGLHIHRLPASILKKIPS